VLRRIFEPKREEVPWDWRRLHNEELHTVYASQNIITMIKVRSIRWAGHVARIREIRNAYRILVGKPEWKRPLGRTRRGWEDNIGMDLREIEWEDVDWIRLAQDRDQLRAVVDTVINFGFRKRQ
jgi:hypothetical protein